MKKLILILVSIAFIGCAQLLVLPQPDSPVVRDVTAVEMSRDIENVRLIIHAKNGWLEQDNNTLYVRFNATPLLSEQADNTLRSLFIPCRYVGVVGRSLAFRCRPSVTVYPEVTHDYLDLVFTP